MPAYFGIRIEFDKSTLHQHYVADFYSLLERNRVKWLCGYRDNEGLCRRDSIRNDQTYTDGTMSNKMRKNHYYQDMFEYMGYSEFRAYWDSFEKTMEITIIIPEDDFLLWDLLEKGKLVPRNYQAMEPIKELCIKIWEMWDCLSIQTQWECTYDYVHGLEEIRKGTRPQILPFAIIPERVYKDRWEYSTTRIGNEGLLLEDDEGWE